MVNTYRSRVLDDELDALLPGLPAISLEGPKGVGKTATAMQRAAQVLRLDEPAQAQLLSADPSRLARGPYPLLIDEWQRLPAAWDLVRRAVDDDPSPGRFLLTGSAAPKLTPMHSGAGRIVTLRMRPLTLVERGVSPPRSRWHHCWPRGSRRTQSPVDALSLCRTTPQRSSAAASQPCVQDPTGRSEPPLTATCSASSRSSYQRQGRPSGAPKRSGAGSAPKPRRAPPRPPTTRSATRQMPGKPTSPPSRRQGPIATPWRGCSSSSRSAPGRRPSNT